MVPLYSSPPFGGFAAPRAASPALACSDSGAIGKSARLFDFLCPATAHQVASGTWCFRLSQCCQKPGSESGHDLGLYQICSSFLPVIRVVVLMFIRA